MATAQSKLEMLIEAKNNSSSAINKAKADISGLDKAAGEASKGLDSLFAAAGVAGFAALASNVANAAFEMGELGAQSLMVGDSFEGTATRLNSSSGEMLDAMKRASRGMIDEQALMLGANRAMILGVADGVDEMGALLEVAGVRAKIMGTDVGAAYADLVTGIGRMSPLMN